MVVVRMGSEEMCYDNSLYRTVTMCLGGAEVAASDGAARKAARRLRSWMFATVQRASRAILAATRLDRGRRDAHDARV